MTENNVYGQISENVDDFLSHDEQDALGEIGNICMGTSATTLSTLLGKQVDITTPRVSVHESAKSLGTYERPYFVVEVSYTKGVNGYNMLLMKEDDVKVITNLLMGGDGAPNPDTEIDELHFSAISEVMNQMVGSSATALASIVGQTIDISPPDVKRVMIDGEAVGGLMCQDDRIIRISFLMEIQGILKSELMQIMQYDFGVSLARVLLGDIRATEAEQAAPPAVQAPQQPLQAQAATPAQMPIAAPPAAAQRPQTPPLAEQNRIGVKSIQYDSFDSPARGHADGGDNLGLIMDVPLQVTVELGKTKKTIKEVLSLNTGSVVVLDRLAGEMVDVMVNGKLYAKGEVVVIDDNYGVRITEIVAHGISG